MSILLSIVFFVTRLIVALSSICLCYVAFGTILIRDDWDTRPLRNFIGQPTIAWPIMGLSVALSLLWLIMRSFTTVGGRNWLSQGIVLLLEGAIWLARRLPKITPLDLLVVVTPASLWGLYLLLGLVD